MRKFLTPLILTAALWWASSASACDYTQAVVVQPVQTYAVQPVVVRQAFYAAPVVQRQVVVRQRVAVPVVQQRVIVRERVRSRVNVRVRRGLFGRRVIRVRVR